MYKPSPLFMVQLLSEYGIKLPRDFTSADQLADLTNDTRQLNLGDVFCAVIGHVVDGREYITWALV